MPNVSNLLQYNAHDIQYRIYTQDASLTTPINIPTHTLDTQPGQLQLHCTRPQIRENHDRFFSSVGMKTMGELIDEAAERGRQAVLEKIGEYARDRQAYGRISDGVRIADIFRQKFASEQASGGGTLEIKQTEKVDISYQMGECNISFVPSSQRFTWDIERARGQYTPPDCGMEILSTPRVDFRYTGGWLLAPEGASESSLNMLI